MTERRKNITKSEAQKMVSSRDNPRVYCIDILEATACPPLNLTTPFGDAVVPDVLS